MSAPEKKEIKMTDTTQEEELLEPTPYENAYRRTLSEPDEDELDPAVEQAATPRKSDGVVQKEEHDYKKRYDDLKKHYDTKLNEWRQNREIMEAKLKMSDQPVNVAQELPKTREELDSFRDQYPDVYDVVETISTLKAQDKVKEVEDQLEYLKEKEVEAERITSEKQLLSVHPDFNELKTDENFINWLEDQPENISDGVYHNSSDVKWAARVIDLYKSDIGQSRSKRSNSKQTNAQAAQAVTRTSKGLEPLGSDKKVWTIEEISRLKPWEYEKLEKEIDAAVRDGRVVDSI